ncbi:MAG: glycoside hydrolase family 16 protein [Planctomycetaceae bacterium]|nr:glycoside hydrolase family 16 protein [Planctomycetaceae bacterium]
MRRVLPAIILALSATTAALGQAAPRVPLDDFEKAPEGWKYVGGEEFPGAKGGWTADAAVAHGGKASFRLEADFSGGGAYVGTWKELASLKGRDVGEIRFWAKTSGVTKLGVRLLDSSDQIHQAAVDLRATPDWQEVALKIASLAGGEHWGGANDGKWHGPLKGFGLNVGKNALAAGQAKGTLWIDDVEAVPGPVVDGMPTIHAAVITPSTCRPGWGARITYRWEAEPLGRDYAVFVHYQGTKGTVMQGDHGPSVPTSVWSGKIEYTKVVVIPEDLPDGEYRIVMGLWENATGTRHALKTTAGVTPLEGNAYQIGVIKVDSKAPLPVLPKPTLKLDDYKLAWSDEFNDLSVSAHGPGTRWIAHTPYNGDFGDAGFADPKPGFPFTVDKGILRIEASKGPDGRWRGGLLSSVDAKGQGFSQKFGYFEMRAKFPRSLGMWPAFWLMGVEGIHNKKIANIEIDVVEQYGSMPNTLMATLHTWGPGDKHWGEGDGFFVPGMADDFHTYGAMVDEKDITIYYDGVELWRQKTLPEAKVPLYIMVDLAMGGGWPIDKAISPSYMYVDYVRAYAKK